MEKRYGMYRGFGWVYIWNHHKDDFRIYHEEKLRRAVNDEELKMLIKEDIGKALKEGNKKKIDDVTVEYKFIDMYSKDKYAIIHVRVSVDERNMGSIQTSFVEIKNK